MGGTASGPVRGAASLFRIAGIELRADRHHVHAGHAGHIGQLGDDLAAEIVALDPDLIGAGGGQPVRHLLAECARIREKDGPARNRGAQGRLRRGWRSVKFQAETQTSSPGSGAMFFFVRGFLKKKKKKKKKKKNFFVFSTGSVTSCSHPAHEIE